MGLKPTDDEMRAEASASQLKKVHGLKPDLQGGTGFNLLRVQFWTPCKRNVFQKGPESGPA